VVVGRRRPSSFGWLVGLNFDPNPDGTVKKKGYFRVKGAGLAISLGTRKSQFFNIALF
jgi:hypothetical protein